jgi:hypothetical protein
VKKLLQFKYVFYASLLLAAVFLYRGGYFQPVAVQHGGWLALSVVLLLAGLGVLAWAWQRMLRSSGLTINYADAFVSTNLVALAKYVPGKVMLLHGVTAWLHDRRHLSRKQVGATFVLFNLLYIATGMLVGAMLLPSLDAQMMRWYGLAGLVAVLCLVFFNQLIKWGLGLLGRILKRPDLQEMSDVRLDAAAVAAAILVWLLWGVGMLLLIGALRGELPPWSVVFAYPLSVSLGAAAIFAPGGMGVRESILGFWLVQTGYETAFATTVSAVSRLWFLAGELTAFGVAIIWDRRLRRRELEAPLPPEPPTSSL